MSGAYTSPMNIHWLPPGRRHACSVALLIAMALQAQPLRADEKLPAAPPVPDTIGQRVAACTACHGVHGEGTPRSGFFPRLAGKPAGYLARQLQDFQDGLRKYAPMQYTVRGLSPAYMREIAEYFSAQQVPYVRSPMPAVSPATLARGEALVLRGDPVQKIPACRSCHGAQLTGVQPNIPALIGLPYDYVSSQLGSWRTHTRSTVAPDCMAVIANRLSAADIGAVAAWLATRELPDNLHPQAPGSITPPLPCGVLGAKPTKRATSPLSSRIVALLQPLAHAVWVAPRGAVMHEEKPAETTAARLVVASDSLAANAHGAVLSAWIEP